MNIDSIVNGIVIDHITAGRAMRLYELLGLGEADCSVAIIKIDADLPINLDVIGYVGKDHPRPAGDHGPVWDRKSA